MANGTLPPVVADALSQDKRKQPLPVLQVKKEREPSKVTAVLVEVPIGELDSKFPNGRIDVHLGDEHAKKLRRILNGLKGSDSRLKDGRPPSSIVDVVRWFLDQVE